MSFRLALAWAGVDGNNHKHQQAIIKAENERFEDTGESVQARFRRKMMEARAEDYGEIPSVPLDLD